jgi:hypothetical protein
MPAYIRKWWESSPGLTANSLLSSIWGGTHQNISLSQRNRPEDLKSVNVVMNEVYGLQRNISNEEVIHQRALSGITVTM